jgi:hypothetical protein
MPPQPKERFMTRTARRSFVAVILAGVVAVALAFVAPTPAAAQEGPKNLQILPKTLTKDQLKKLMKGIASSLGVQCDHCHDTDDYPKDTEKKEIARAMMKMTGEINKNFFEGKPEVGCITCHNGKKEPKHPPK